ncbi:DNA gyrase subunit A [Candidatus Campbellbacteria bacterium]|nr:MAG: DNA gyrase subunit A [Candidatus Campbellbacteria bacterium]
MSEEKNNKNLDNVLEHKSIIEAPIVDTMRKSYIDYAMSVITDRALPDVRDGMKPVHRRIIYSMHKNNLTAFSKFMKSARVVGDVLGKYHPHGDAAVYLTMVGMAQDFTYRYPLIWGQGNFGSVDGDSPAAHRYTEAKMQKITSAYLSDIEKETVEYAPNYDGSMQEPKVLPTRVPGLLLNGTLGIAVGMATNIPPHNLKELTDATEHILDNPTCSVKDLMQFVKGPDFPLGGIVFNNEDILEAYQTGRGGVVVRGHAEVEESDGGGSKIVVTSLPFRVNKAVFVEKIANLFRDKKITGLKDLRDESTADIRVVIELKRGAFAQKILNYLYKNTQLEEKFNFNMVALVEGVPKTLNLKDVLEDFIAHRKEVIYKATEFDLKKAEARAHILEGLKKALDHIDQVIKIIKASKDTVEAKSNLIKKFKFTEIQAQAILDMKLQKLAGLERKKIEDELKELLAKIKDLKDILSSPARIIKIIKEQLNEVAEQYGDERRTVVVPQKAGNFKVEDLIPNEQSTLVLTEKGYLKRTNPKEFKAQKRGGKGVSDMSTKDDDVISEFITSSTHSDILFFSSKGKVYRTKMYELPEGKRTTKGKFIANFLPLEEGENITSVLTMDKEIKESAESLIMVTKNGTVKKTAADAFFEVRANGLIAISLKNDDELIDARFVKEQDDVVLTSQQGKTIHFESSQIRNMGRTAGGVRGIKLGKDDIVVSLSILEKGRKDDAYILVITQNGYGKQTKATEYKTQARGGSGIKTAKVTEKTGLIVKSSVVYPEHEEVIAMSKNSQVIRISIDSVPKLNRDTQGVRIMRLKEGDSVVSFVRF